MPRAQRLEARRLGVVVPRLDLDVRVRAVGDLLVRVEDRLLVAGMRRASEPDGHPLREERAVVGTRQEVAPAAPDDAEPGRHGGEDVLERAATRPPELVRVGVDHPVRAVLGRREPRHPASPTRPGASRRPARAASRSLPARSYRSRISVVPSLDALSVAITWSTPACRWNAICASTTSASSRASRVMTSLIGRAVYGARHPSSTRPVAATLDALVAENRELRRELNLYRERLSAFERSRWWRLHPDVPSAARRGSSRADVATALRPPPRSTVAAPPDAILARTLRRRGDAGGGFIHDSLLRPRFSPTARRRSSTTLEGHDPAPCRLARAQLRSRSSSGSRARVLGRRHRRRIRLVGVSLRRRRSDAVSIDGALARRAPGVTRIEHDLDPVGREFGAPDLGLCLEVAEHLEPAVGESSWATPSALALERSPAPPYRPVRARATSTARTRPGVLGRALRAPRYRARGASLADLDDDRVRVVVPAGPAFGDDARRSGTGQGDRRRSPSRGRRHAAKLDVVFSERPGRARRIG